SRGRQFIAKAVEDLSGTRQSGFVLTRQKGEGRKAVATYALKKVSSQGDSPGRHPPHPPHPPHTPAGAETSAESTAATDAGNEDASGMQRLLRAAGQPLALGRGPARSQDKSVAEGSVAACARPSGRRRVRHRSRAGAISARVAKMSTLQRTTFKTGRLLEFCTRKELNQQGESWPLDDFY